MISLVIPAYNEEKNIRILFEHIKSVDFLQKNDFEVLFIDDGSSDNTAKEVISLKDECVRLIQLKKNYGQTPAMLAGFHNAKGEIIVTLDADLQNDPSDIEKMVQVLNKGYDVVCGWRKNRRDPFTKRYASKGARLIRRVLLNDRINDPGCTLKAFRAYAVKDIMLYGETHRFIPAILREEGYKVAEMVVKHHPRKHGFSKYRSKRFINGIMDILVIRFYRKYQTKPLHLLGRIGLICFFMSFLLIIYNLVRFWPPRELGPTLFLSVILFVMGVQFIVFGIMLDVLVRTQIESTGRKPYEIKQDKN